MDTNIVADTVADNSPQPLTAAIDDDNANRLHDAISDNVADAIPDATKWQHGAFPSTAAINDDNAINDNLQRHCRHRRRQTRQSNVDVTTDADTDVVTYTTDPRHAESHHSAITPLAFCRSIQPSSVPSLNKGPMM